MIFEKVFEIFAFAFCQSCVILEHHCIFRDTLGYKKGETPELGCEKFEKIHNTVVILIIIWETLALETFCQMHILRSFAISAAIFSVFNFLVP